MGTRLRLIGEGPSATGSGPPLDGWIAETLRDCAGPSFDLDACERVNLFDRHQTAWDAGKARAAADALGFAPVTVLFGRRVAEAFGLGRLAFFARVDVDDASVWLLPHPSSRNLLFNRPEVRERVGACLRAATRESLR